MPIIMNERKECRKCKYFSKHLAWWEWIWLPVEIRKKIIGRCFRPRDNLEEYPIMEVENKKKKSCKYFKEVKDAEEGEN